MIYYIQYTKTVAKQENIADLKFDISSFIGIYCAHVSLISLARSEFLKTYGIY